MRRQVIIGLTVLALALPVLALAEVGAQRGCGQGMHQKCGPGPRGERGKMNNLTAEQREKLKAMRERHRENPCNKGDVECRDARKAERDAILTPPTQQQ